MEGNEIEYRAAEAKVFAAIKDAAGGFLEAAERLQQANWTLNYLVNVHPLSFAKEGWPMPAPLPETLPEATQGAWAGRSG
jgi:hypothetical protein